MTIQSAAKGSAQRQHIPNVEAVFMGQLGWCETCQSWLLEEEGLSRLPSDPGTTVFDIAIRL